MINMLMKLVKWLFMIQMSIVIWLMVLLDYQSQLTHYLLLNMPK